MDSSAASRVESSPRRPSATPSHRSARQPPVGHEPGGTGDTAEKSALLSLLVFADASILAGVRFSQEHHRGHRAMGLVSGYNNDVFISYSHIDNQPFGDPRADGSTFFTSICRTSSTSMSDGAPAFGATGG